ncbi:MAG: glycine cleavage system protein H [Desulfobacteraceae bacterium]|nr:glycine cleavage system protein H [Desulfobacteraceae bacterium]
MKTANKAKTVPGARKTVKGFQVVDEPCIWMKAGVVNYRNCDNHYDCNTCAFDKALRRAMGAGLGSDTRDLAPQWVAHLRQQYDGASRPCRHALTGRVQAPKICTMNYECYHCTFDQMLDEMDLAEDGRAPVVRSASGYRVADGCYYHMGHSWVRFEHGGRARIGFDDFLVRLFGPAGELELPPLGARLVRDDVGWRFERDRHGAAVLSPITGTVLCLNHRAQTHPEIAHEDPYHTGWLMIVEPDSPKRSLKRLFYGEESVRWIEQESEKLLGMMGPEYEKLAATGAEPIGDVFGNIPEIGWDRLVETFLHTVHLIP